MKVKRHWILGTMAVWVLLCGWSLATANAIELKFAHTMVTSDTMHKGTLRFAELVKQKTGGEVNITVYPAGQLGKDSQILQGVRMGTIDIAMTGVPWHASFAPFLNVLDLPYLFRDYEHAYKVLDGELGRKLLDKLEPLGMKGLGFFEIGFRNITNSKRAVRTPDDVKGLKLRTTGNPYHVLAWKLLGAIPTPLPWPDVYMAMKTKTVDGQENPVTLIHGAKFFEVQQHLSLTMHAYSASAIDMNLKKFNSLKPAHQKVLFEAVLEAEAEHRKKNRELEAPMIKEMREKGMQIIEDIDRQAFAELVTKGVQEEYAKKFGWDLVEKINNIK